MRKIYSLFGVVISIFLFACGVVRTSPFGETSLILIPTSQEVALGREAAKQIERKEKLCSDPVSYTHLTLPTIA
jgi:hypothetical protein